MKEEIEKKEIDETSLDTRCPACSASISFNPKEQKWKCDYCGSTFSIEEMQKHKNSSEAKQNQKKKVSKEEDPGSYVSYKCQSCGAEIVADEQTAATFCVYCGNTAILKSKLDGKFAPDYVIPFKKTKEDAVEAFKSLNKGRPLMPKFFNKEENIEKIKGVYIPFWLYNVDVSGELDIKGTIVTSWTSGDTHYTKTDTYSKHRAGTVGFKRIPVDGASRFANDIMNTIEPFNYGELTPYNHAYLSGFYAERYDEEGDKVFKEVADRAKNTATSVMKNDGRSYQSEVITRNTLEPKEISKEYAMLPVWMVNIRFGGKMHTFAMNGQTGEFVGNIPISGKKFAFYLILQLVVFALIALVLSYVFFMMGGN